MQPIISVIIPAHNEEKYIGRCIRSVRKAASEFGGGTEIIVVCNRCTDRTEDIAGSLGARVLKNEDRCIAKVRNTGIAAAKGKIIVTIDADNRMTKGTLKEIYALLKSGRYIGGGAPMMRCKAVSTEADYGLNIEPDDIEITDTVTVIWEIE